MKDHKNGATERDMAVICVSVCREVCGVYSLFELPAENPVRIRHEDRVWSVDQFLDVNWITWAMRFAPNQTADALTALAADTDNLHLEEMTEREIQLEWFWAMYEMMC